MAGDALAITRVFQAARAEALPYLPILHADAEDRRFFARTIARSRTWVAEDQGQVVAFLALREDWVDHLYVNPTHYRRGLGGRLLEIAKAESPGGLRLYTFQRNARARSFYEKRGFVVVELGDGSGNEEREPDVLYELKKA
jgi:GNAT superfamily N-acetyltransferase